MNAVDTVENPQSICADERPLREPVFDLERIIGRVQNRQLTGDLGVKTHLVKSGAKKRLNVGQKEDVKPIIRRPGTHHRPSHTHKWWDSTSAKEIVEFGNNLEGAGDGFESSNIWNKSVNEGKMHLPSYLQPTLSYRMKCVHRSKNDTGDGKRIPFVVGNYATKSHNVGSKIQETLSLIKGAPRRVLEKAKMERGELRNLIRCATTQATPPLARSQGELTRRGAAITKRNRSANSMDSRTPIIDYKNHQFRTVLMNLQDEYAKMNAKCEELKNSLKAKYSVEVAHKVLNLEEDLNVKHVEIGAFVNLYNEGTQLLLVNKKTVVESINLIQKSKGANVLVKNGSMALLAKCGERYKKFKVLFNSGQDAEDCADCLKKYIKTVVDKPRAHQTSENANQPTNGRDLQDKEGRQPGDETLVEILDRILLNGNSSLPAPECIPEDYPLESAVRLCILDPGFPKLVERIEAIINSKG